MCGNTVEVRWFEGYGISYLTGGDALRSNPKQDFRISMFGDHVDASRLNRRLLIGSELTNQRGARMVLMNSYQLGDG